jgi:hypothetical protein
MPATPLPYTFVNGVSTLDAATTNANNAALYAAVTNVDHSQIGVAGIFASQIVPTNGFQATFGGTDPYTFPTLIIAPAASFIGGCGAAHFMSGSTGGYCPPMYNLNGSLGNPLEHIVRGTLNIPIPSGVMNASAQVGLAGSAVFTNATSYFIVAQQAATSNLPLGWNPNTVTCNTSVKAASGFTIVVANSQSSTGAGSVNVDYIAMGY